MVEEVVALGLIAGAKLVTDVSGLGEKGVAPAGDASGLGEGGILFFCIVCD